MRRVSSLQALNFNGNPIHSILILSSRISGYSIRQIAASLAGAAILACTGAAFCQDQADAEKSSPPSAAEVQEKVRQWVRTQQLISEEQADWEAEKQVLADLNELREREVAELDELIAAAGTRLTDAETQRDELLAEEQSLRERRAELEKGIAALESAARELLPGLPSPLREKLGGAIERLESGEDKADVPLQNRYRDVLAVLIEVGTFQSSPKLHTELRELDGKSVEVEVLYLGLATAWFTDRTGKYAGAGRPGEDGWTWTSQPELAAKIRKAIEVYQKKASPELIELPLQLRLKP